MYTEEKAKLKVHRRGGRSQHKQPAADIGFNLKLAWQLWWRYEKDKGKEAAQACCDDKCHAGYEVSAAHRNNTRAYPFGSAVLKDLVCIFMYSKIKVANIAVPQIGCKNTKTKIQK